MLAIWICPREATKYVCIEINIVLIDFSALCNCKHPFGDLICISCGWGAIYSIKVQYSSQSVLGWLLPTTSIPFRFPMLGLASFYIFQWPATFDVWCLYSTCVTDIPFALKDLPQYFFSSDKCPPFLQDQTKLSFLWEVCLDTCSYLSCSPLIPSPYLCSHSTSFTSLLKHSLLLSLIFPIKMRSTSSCIIISMIYTLIECQKSLLGTYKLQKNRIDLNAT